MQIKKRLLLSGKINLHKLILSIGASLGREDEKS